MRNFIAILLVIIFFLGCSHVPIEDNLSKQPAEKIDWVITEPLYILSPSQSEFWASFSRAQSFDVCLEKTCGIIIEYEGSFGEFVESFALQAGNSKADEKLQRNNLPEPTLVSSNYVDWKNVMYALNEGVFYWENASGKQTIIVQYNTKPDSEYDMDEEQARVLLEDIEIIE